jgi:glycolate oxidase iron-sulfur subunit
MERARETARRNIDAWWPLIENGAEAVLLTATGCAPTVMDYGRLLAGDGAYAERAERLASMAMDISVFLERNDLEPMRPPMEPAAPIAFHSPCSLQHGLKRPGAVERLLQALGFELTPVADAHLCCGSAGAYSLLQPNIANQLRSRKLNALEAGQPALIATANIGCLQHLQAGTDVEVKHWIELLV